MKLKNIVDFTWEHNFYPGQLLAVHMSGKYLAYGIKGNLNSNLNYNYIFLSFKFKKVTLFSW